MKFSFRKMKFIVRDASAYIEYGPGKTVIFALLGVVMLIATLWFIHIFDTERIIANFFIGSAESIKKFFDVKLEKYFDFIGNPLRPGQMVLLGLIALYILGAIIGSIRNGIDSFFVWFAMIFYTLVMFLISSLLAPYERFYIAGVVLVFIAVGLQVVTALLVNSDNIALRVVITLIVASIAGAVGYGVGSIFALVEQFVVLFVFPVFFFAQLDAVFDELFSGGGTPVRSTVEDVVSTMVGDEVDLSDWADM